MTVRTTFNATTEPVHYGRAEPIASALRTLRWRVRVRLVAERLAMVTAGAIAVIVVAAGIDFIVHLPLTMRALALGCGVVVALAWLLRTLWPLMRFRPGLIELALRVERAPGAAQAGLPGRLASALDLAGSTPGWADPSLVDRAVSDAVGRFKGFPASRALLRGSAAQRGMLSLAVSLLPVLLAFWAIPTYSRIGTLRVLAPWLNIEWPKVTGVTSATSIAAHPIDTPITLRAQVHTTNKPVGQTRVECRWRVVLPGAPGVLTRVLMNPVRRGESAGSDVYETAISRDALAQALGASPQAVIEFQFATSDDETTTDAVALVERPRVTEATVAITPPAYASAAKESAMLAGSFPVTPDAAGRSSHAPVLAGSRVRLEMTLNKPVPVPGRETPSGSGPAGVPELTSFVTRTFGAGGLPRGATFSFDETRWILEFEPTASLAIDTTPVDGWSIPAAEPLSVALSVVADQPPTAATTEPPADESVLPTAMIPVTGEARDDVELGWTELRVKAFVKPDSAGAPPEARGEAASMGRVEGSGAASAKTKVELDLATLSLKPGDEVEIQTAAADRFEGHAPVLSAPRRLRIISEAQLTQQVLDDLAALRSASDRLAREQATLRDATAKAVASREAGKPDERRGELNELRGRQGSITERVAPARELLDRAKARIERNAMTDQSLREMLDRAGELALRAAESSREAERDLAKAAAEANAPEDSERAQIDQEQAKAAENLSNLADMLSQGQDAFAARRQVEKLLADQKELTAEASKATQQSAGKKPEQLTPQERSALERLAAQQLELARRAERAADELSKRSEAVKPRDPAQAEAMKKAAEETRREAVPQRMEEAAKQLQQNQGEQAGQEQEQAAEALEKILEELDKAQQRRDDVLERLLADLAKSIQVLVDTQKAELGSLADAAKSGSFRGLSEGMTRLYGNTLALSSSTAVREAQMVMDRLGTAGEHQSRAAGLLRAEKVDDAAAEREERSSLTRLEEALAEAKKKQQEAAAKDEARKRAELAKKYGEVLQKQAKLNEDTKPLVGAELSRRDRNVARGLATRQSEVRGEVDRLREEIAAGGASDLFDYAHKRFDGLAQRAEKPLGQGEVPAAVGRDQAEALRVLRSVASALASSSGPDSNPFRRPGQGNEDGGGKNQGGQGGNQPGQNAMVPPIAQIMLLRTMQQEAAERTRALGEAGAGADPAELMSVAELQRDLAEIGRKVVEILNQANGKPPAEPPAGNKIEVSR